MLLRTKVVLLCHQ